MRAEPRFPFVVLAAGASTRLGGGRAKQLLAIPGGTSLLRRAAETALAAAGAGSPVIVVLGHRAGECAVELAGLAVATVRAENWAAGMGASLKAGVRAALARAPDAAGIVVSLCDQPLVTAAHLVGLRERVARGSGPRTVAGAEYGGGPGVPACFGQGWFGEIQGLDDASGARGLLLQADDAGWLERVPMPEAAADVDTPEDATRLGEMRDWASSSAAGGPLPPAAR